MYILPPHSHTPSAIITHTTHLHTSLTHSYRCTRTPTVIYMSIHTFLYVPQPCVCTCSSYMHTHVSTSLSHMHASAHHTPSYICTPSHLNTSIMYGTLMLPAMTHMQHSHPSHSVAYTCITFIIPSCTHTPHPSHAFSDACTHSLTRTHDCTRINRMLHGRSAEHMLLFPCIFIEVCRCSL